MKVASWNLNSIRARKLHLEDWLEKEKPDILLLQELKTDINTLPILDCPYYNLVGSYQKTYNGVAILSKYILEDVNFTFPNNPDDTQARYIEATCITELGYTRFVSVYCPNGEKVNSQKFEYKLKFYNAFIDHIKTLRKNDEILIVGGDYNITPAIIDSYDNSSEEILCCSPMERKIFAKLQHWLIDSYRVCHPQRAEFTWWDYRGNSFAHNKGLRIDHILLNPKAADRLYDCYIDFEERSKTQPSDHAPIISMFK